jgi:DNA-binding NarL/FixJ family response regulator
VNPIRVILAEDHTIVRKGLRALLESAMDIEVVAEAADGRMALDLVADMRPDVVVMDITMPLLNGLEATRQLKQQYPDLKIVILTMHSYMSPAISKKVIAEYIRQAEKGLEPSSLERLTRREREVLQLVAEGHSMGQIAGLLYISEKTARVHRSHLMSKLDLHNTAELTLYAVRHGVISLDEDQA